MATVRLNRAEIRVETMAMALRLARQFLYEVEFEAKIIAARGTYASGALATSIFTDGPHVIGDRVTGRVGTELPYAASVHSGAKVHAIFPKGSVGVWRPGDRHRPQLKFFWRKRGRTAYFPHIPGGPATVGRSHPGQKGKEFISEPMRDAARRHSMRYISTDI
jgi:hypothetical protein